MDHAMNSSEFSRCHRFRLRRGPGRLVWGLMFGLLCSLGLVAQEAAVPQKQTSADAVPAKSRPSSELVTVEFRNETTGVADGFWMDFEGQARHYVTLPPEGAVPMQTYAGHVWHWYVNDTLAQKYLAGEAKSQTVSIKAPPATGPLRVLLPTELYVRHPNQFWDSSLVTQTQYGSSSRMFSSRSGGLPIDSLLVTPVIELTSRADGPQQQREIERLKAALAGLYAATPDYKPETTQAADGLGRQTLQITFPALEMVDPSRQNPPGTASVWKGKTVEKPPISMIPSSRGQLLTPCLEIPWLPPDVGQTFEAAFFSHLVIRQAVRIGAEQFDYESEMDLVRKPQLLASPQQRLTFVKIDPSLLTWNQVTPQISPLVKVQINLTQETRTLTRLMQPTKAPSGNWVVSPAVCWPVIRPNFDQDPLVIANIQFTMADNQVRQWPENGKNLFSVIGPKLLLEIVDFDWIFDPPVVTY